MTVDLQEARARLKEWGYWMRRAPDLPDIGYPSQAVGAELMDQPQAIEDEKYQKYAERMAIAAKKPYTRNVVHTDPQTGKARIKREVVRPMVPRAQPHDTKSMRPENFYDPWPEEVKLVNAVIARLPYDEKQVIHTKYWLRLGRDVAKKRLEISERAYREALARAEGSVRQGLASRAA